MNISNMYSSIFVLLCAAILISQSDFSSACNGYEFILQKFHECGDNNVIKYKNPNSKIDAACDVIPEGCMHSDGYKSAMLSYRIEKKPLPVLEGEFDLCKGIPPEDEDVAVILSFMHLPETCPVDKFERCADGSKTINIEKHKHKLELGVGIISTNVTIKHDNGVTCVNAIGELRKLS